MQTQDRTDNDAIKERLPYPFSRSEFVNWEKAFRLYAKSKPNNSYVIDEAGVAPPSFNQTIVASYQDLLNSQREKAIKYERLDAVIETRIFYATRRHAAPQQLQLDQYEALVAELYPPGELPSIHQVAWQDPDDEAITADIDNELTLEEVRLIHRQGMLRLKSQQESDREVSKARTADAQRMNKLMDVASQSNASILRAIVNSVDPELRGDLCKITSAQSAYNILHSKYAALSDYDQQNIYERRVKAIESDVAAGKFAVSTVKKVRQLYLDTYGSSSAPGSANYVSFAHRIVALITKAQELKLYSYQPTLNYLTSIAGVEGNLDWRTLIGHLERGDNTEAAKREVDTDSSDQPAKLRRTTTEKSHAPHCKKPNCGDCVWHSSSSYFTCQCSNLPTCKKWDGLTNRAAHFSIHKDCPANPTRSSSSGNGRPPKGPNTGNPTGTALSRKELDILIKAVNKSVNGNGGCKSDLPPGDNNNGGPGPSGGGGNGGGRRRPGPRGNGPRLNALQNRYQKDNDSSMDVEDPQETELQENTTIGDSGAMEHIVDAGQHSNQVNKMFDAMINIGARRDHIWYSNTFGADAKWDEVFRVVNVSQLSFFNQETEISDFEDTNEGNPSVKRTASGEEKLLNCREEAMNREMFQGGNVQLAVFA